MTKLLIIEKTSWLVGWFFKLLKHRIKLQSFGGLGLFVWVFFRAKLTYLYVNQVSSAFIQPSILH